MSWDDVGNTIVAAVRAASALPASRVVWKHQNYNAPPQTYVTINLPTILEKGQDWIETTTDLNRPRGQEVEIKVRGIREVSLELECFTDQSVSGDGQSAVSKLLEITTRLRLPGVRALLQEQGVSPFETGRINWIPDIPGTNFRGRAVCSIRCYIPLPSYAEYAGFIERVIGSFTSEGTTTITTPFDTASVPDPED